MADKYTPRLKTKFEAEIAQAMHRAIAGSADGFTD